MRRSFDDPEWLFEGAVRIGVIVALTLLVSGLLSVFDAGLPGAIGGFFGYVAAVVRYTGLLTAVMYAVARARR
ncbi:hypothetical protein [Halomarina pelagica]|uniref:hypothetical protein n=1 Tax=Halomarina pelagica TaxID=2961599 RepID=UPI0020C53CD8|nr:hypothetical protein [Halomarina sp. BND7]